MTERRIDQSKGWPTPTTKPTPLESISNTQHTPKYTASTYFTRLAKMIHSYSHGAPFFSVTVKDGGTWYEFVAGPGAGSFGAVMPVTLNAVEVTQVDHFMDILTRVEDTYEKFIDLKYIKNIAHKLTADERKRVQKWIADGNSIENL